MYDIEQRDRQRIGMRVRQIREEMGMTQTELAERVGGISRQYIGHIERGRGSLSFPVLHRLVRALNVPYSAVLDEESASHLTRQAAIELVERAVERVQGVPVSIVGYVPADAVRWTSGGDLGSVTVTPAEIEGTHDAFAVIVRGDCLRGLGIFDGDIVILDRDKSRRPQHREIVLVEIDGEYSLKRWHVETGTIELRDGNEKVVRILECDANLSVLGYYVTFRPVSRR